MNGVFPCQAAGPLCGNQRLILDNDRLTVALLQVNDAIESLLESVVMTDNE